MKQSIARFLGTVTAWLFLGCLFLFTLKVFCELLGAVLRLFQ